jgi:hypothetical protein
LSEPASDAQRRKRFLDAACRTLGFCLPPKAQEDLVERSDLSSKDFVSAVIAAEGIEPVHLETYEHFRPLMDLYSKHILDN